MYRRPSRKCKFAESKKPNLNPLLDSTFIFIFFLLYYATFVHFFEISSEVPLVSGNPPPDKTPPLALTVKVQPAQLEVYTGIPAVRQKVIGRTSEGSYDFAKLREYLFALKKKHLQENSAILEPQDSVPYDELVKVMDAIRTIKNTDEEIFATDKNGISKKLNELFGQIIFGNIQS